MPVPAPPLAARSADAAPPGPGRTAAVDERLRSRFTRLLMLAIVLPALLFGALQLVSEYRTGQANLREQVRVATRLTAMSVEQFMGAHSAGVALLADTAARNGHAPELSVLRQRYPALITALVTDRSGFIIALEPRSRAADEVRPNVADRDYFAVPADTGQPYVSNAFVGRGVGNDPLVAVSAPMIVDGRFEGVVEGSIRIDRFAGLRSAVLRSRGQELLIVDRTGHVIHASEGLPFRFGQALRGQAFGAGEELADGVGPARRHVGVLAEGGDAWAAMTLLRSGWQVVVFAPDQPLLVQMRERALAIGIVLLLAVLGALAVATWQVRRLARAIGTVLNALSGMASGARDATLRPERVPSELRPVARAIVQLVERLDTANQELRDALGQQRALSDSLRQSVEARERDVHDRTVALQAANAELERLSRTDPLTGALNLRGFHAAMEAVCDAAGALTAPAALIAFDVDHFKAYNDGYGHPAGDRALRRVGAAVQATLRDGRDRLARIGGEEFVVVLPEADTATVLAIAERMRESVARLGIPHAGGENGVLSISLGVVAAECGDLFEPLLQQADEALYRAKGGGRNRVAV